MCKITFNPSNHDVVDDFIKNERATLVFVYGELKVTGFY